MIDRSQINDVTTGPNFVIETYKEYNLFIHKNHCYALSQSLNPLEIINAKDEDLTKLQNKRQCFTGKSFAEVKALIDQQNE